MSGVHPSGTTALVTGATGFLGGFLASTLVQRGYKVRAFARQTSDLSRLANLGVEIVRGDLDDPGSLREAAQGQQLVFHCAGRVSDWGARAQFVRANVDGTRHVIEACLEAGVERLVHVSSLTVLGLPRTGELVDEGTPWHPSPPDLYSETKLAGEKLAREAHGRGRLTTTIVRPGVIWGPGDTTIIPRFAALLRRGRMIYLDQGANNLAVSHIENLANGLILASGAAGAGELYHIIDGEELTARSAIDQLAAALGTPPPRVSVPFHAAYATAAGMEVAARLLGHKTPPPITRYAVRLVACHCYYDTTKARRDLGYRPHVSFAEGIAQIAAETAARA